MARLPWIAVAVIACDFPGPAPVLRLSAPPPSSMPPLEMLSPGATIRHLVTPLSSPMVGRLDDSLLLRIQGSDTGTTEVRWENTDPDTGHRVLNLARDGRPHWYRIALRDESTWVDRMVTGVHFDDDVRVLGGFVVSTQGDGDADGIPELLSGEPGTEEPVFLVPGQGRWSTKIDVPRDATLTMEVAAGGPADGPAPSARVEIAFAGDGKAPSFHTTHVGAAGQVVTADLSRHRGESGQLTIRTKPGDGGWVRITGPVIRGHGPGDAPPSILFISIDTLRRDPVGRITPALDRLAEGGGTSLTAISSAPWTLPSHASLLTGREARDHGVVGETRRIPDDIPTLAEHLQAQGYRTLAMVSAPYLDGSFGFARGFHTYDDKTLAVGGHEASHQAGGVETVVDQALRWFGDETVSPTFVFLHVWDIHHDYRPPVPYDQQFDPGYSGSATGDFEAFDPSMSPQDLAHVRALYDGEVAWTDASLGRLFEGLDAMGQLDDMLVMVTADHGEEFFEHGNKGHGNALVPEVLNVPVIVRPPGGKPLWDPAETPNPARLVDVVATLLDLAEVPALPGMDGVPFGNTDRPDAAWSVATWDGWVRHACVTKDWAFLSSDGDTPTRLFDLRSDPTWDRDLSATQPRIRHAFEERWRRQMDAWPGIHLVATIPDDAALSIEVKSESPLGEAALVRADAAGRLSVGEDRLSIGVTARSDSLGILHFVFDPDYAHDPFTIELRLDGNPIAKDDIRVIGHSGSPGPGDDKSTVHVTAGKITTEWNARPGEFPRDIPPWKALGESRRTSIVVGQVAVRGSRTGNIGQPLDPSIRDRLDALGYTE